MTVSLDELGKLAFKTFIQSSEGIGGVAADNLWEKATAKRKTAWIAAGVAVAKVPNSELNHLQTWEPHTVKNCARCGGDHLVNFKQFKGNPISDPDGMTYNYFGLCPNTGDPVLMTKITNNESKG